MAVTYKRLLELLDYNPITGVLLYKTTIKQRGLANPGTEAGYEASDGYRWVMIDSKRYSAHRLAWFYHFGQWPSGFIDHKNRIRNDNRIANLRVGSRSLNRFNSKRNKNNASGCAGVHLDNGKSWRASISVNKRRISLGSFSRLEEAIAARKAANIKFHDAFLGG